MLLLIALLAPIQGVALAPHFEGERTPQSMKRALQEIRTTGASHVMLVVQWGQEDIRHSAIAPYQWGTRDEEIERMLREAREVGLKVLVFPIVRVREQSNPGEWRGKLVPRDRVAWWAAYRRFILHYARIAAKGRAALFSVGSELGNMEHEQLRWRALIEAVRGVFEGQLTYSANWDHFAYVRWWDALDYAGINAYHPVTLNPAATQAELEGAWRLIRATLQGWLALRVGKPLLFTEVGYPSVEGGAVRPYAHRAKGPVDLEEQRRAYAAFTATWPGQHAFFWAWHGQGGPKHIGYTPRGKPAEAVLRRFFENK